MVLSYVKSFSYILRKKPVNIYNTIFRIHSKYTALLLLLFCALASALSVFGQPVRCIIDDDSINNYVESVCWITGTFTLTNVTTVDDDGHTAIQLVPQHQKYYQWIVVVLQFQSILFYAPAHFWKGWENGRLSKLCSTLGCPIVGDDDMDQNNKKLLVDYLTTNYTRVHSVYVIRFVTCEVMNFLILLLNMWILDLMFDQFWVRYSSAVLAMIQVNGEKFSLLANELFPKLVKCSYTNTGPSGSEQLRDAFCLLSLNVVNEKIFAILYIWFVVLLFFSTCHLIFRCITLVSSNLRLKMVQSVVMSSVPTTKMNIEYILRDGKLGNWFILYEIGRNINPNVFENVLDEVAYNKRDIDNFLEFNSIQFNNCE